jgi:signal recognition particle subunit SRP54
MVLLELGRKITNALKKMDNSTTVNEKIIKSILNEIGMALLQADVSLKYVKSLKDKVQLQFKLNESQGNGLRRIVQRAVVDELTNMLETDKKPYQPKKGKSNVVMFVGLQGKIKDFLKIR